MLSHSIWARAPKGAEKNESLKENAMTFTL